MYTAAIAEMILGQDGTWGNDRRSVMNAEKNTAAATAPYITPPVGSRRLQSWGNMGDPTDFSRARGISRDFHATDSGTRNPSNGWSDRV
jgi:hypothetical protein